LFNKFSVKPQYSGKIAYSRESFKIFSWICCPHLDNWQGGMPELGINSARKRPEAEV